MPDPVQVRPAIKKMVRRIVGELSPDTVILYGSYAYGEPDESSDVDLFVVQAGSEPRKQQVAKIEELIRRSWPGVSVQATVYAPEHVMERLRVGDQFIQEILDRGKVLHGKDWREERCSIVVEDPSAYSREWVERADRDLRWMAIGFRERDPGVAGYYLQQALEKLLKAFLMAQGWRLQRTHDLKELLDVALAYESSLAEFSDL
jgi:predicted nucleotidyltransferase